MSEGNSNEELNKPVLRIDGPHRIATAGKSESHEPVREPCLVGQAVGEASEQVQLHASQLARHLQDRRHDVDHREAQLNARIAQLENELRLSRLWLREQNQEFTQREVEVRQQLSDQESRVTAMTAAELAFDESRREFAEQARTREDLLVRREMQVQEAQQRLAIESKKLQKLRHQLEGERQQLEREQIEHQSRCSLLEREQLERLHHQYVEDWKREREELQRQTLQRQQDLDAAYKVLEVRSQRWSEECDQQRGALERDREQLDQRQATLERVRSEVLRLHREALEMRLIAEQLWAQLADQCTPAELTAGVSQLRSQLADEFRFAHQDLAAQRTALNELLVRLDQKQNELTEQRNELLGWFRRRQADLAQKAIELSERNQRFIAERQRVRDQQIETQAMQFQTLPPLPAPTELPHHAATAGN